MVKIYKGAVAFDNEEDVIYSPFYNGYAGGDALSLEIFTYQCNVANPNVPRYNANFSQFPAQDQVFIWAHGNKERHKIAGDNGQSRNAEDIARDFKKMGLRTNFAGSIILWSCFAGVPGGFAEALYIQLRGLGYNSFKLYAPTVATGAMRPFVGSNRYKGLQILSNSLGGKAGALFANNPEIPSPPGLGGWHGIKTYCTMDDLRRITLKQKLSAEV